MTVAVVYELAVADGLPPIAGAAPYDVLARQLPRMLVSQLNAGGDRGVRFFPFLGNDGGKRCFLLVRNQLPPDTLSQMHRQGDVDCIIDGRIHGDGLRLRILDGPTLSPRFEGDLPFDPRAPLEVLPRAEFEVMTILGWQGRPVPASPLSGEALAWLLVARDALLALEAGLPLDGSFDPLRAAQRCVELQPTSDQVQEVVLDLCGHLLGRGHDRGGIGGLVGPLVAAAGDQPAILERAAEILLATGDEPGAVAALSRACRTQPVRPGAAQRLAALLFRGGRLEEARGVLRETLTADGASVQAMAQLAGIEDMLGNRTERDVLCARILERGDPPATIVRLLVAFLLEQDRTAEALGLLERSLQKDGEDVGLRLEHGRALLLSGDSEAALSCLSRVLEAGSSPAVRLEAERLIRIAAVPGLLAKLQVVETAVRAGRLREALGMLKGAMRSSSDCGEVWLLLGMVRQKLLHPRRAERALRRAVRLQPGLGDAHNRLGILLVARGRLADGHAHLLQAQALSPTDSSVRIHLAQACALLGQEREGEAHLAEAARLGASAEMLAAVRRGFFDQQA